MVCWSLCVVWASVVSPPMSARSDLSDGPADQLTKNNCSCTAPQMVSVETWGRESVQHAYLMAALQHQRRFHTFGCERDENPCRCVSASALDVSRAYHGKLKEETCGNQSMDFHGWNVRKGAPDCIPVGCKPG